MCCEPSHCFKNIEPVLPDLGTPYKTQPFSSSLDFPKHVRGANTHVRVAGGYQFTHQTCKSWNVKFGHFGSFPALVLRFFLSYNYGYTFLEASLEISPHFKDAHKHHTEGQGANGAQPSFVFSPDCSMRNHTWCQGWLSTCLFTLFLASRPAVCGLPASVKGAARGNVTFYSCSQSVTDPTHVADGA